MRRLAAAFFILALLAAPSALAVVPGGKDTRPVATEPDFNLTGINLTNSTLPAQYQATPEPVRVEVTVSDTLIPAPKGEMQAGPRAIGFAGDPVTLAAIGAAILVVVAGIWFLARRKPENGEDQEEENGR